MHFTNYDTKHCLQMVDRTLEGVCDLTWVQILLPTSIALEETLQKRTGIEQDIW